MEFHVFGLTTMKQNSALTYDVFGSNHSNRKKPNKVY